jgi:streptogramin lyase
MSRYWGLSKRATVVVFAVVVVLGVGIAALTQSGGSSSPRSPRHALWAFGFVTLRFDPLHPGPPKRLEQQGYGSVLGVPGRVYFYEQLSGRVGRLDPETNRVEDLGQVPSGEAPADDALPALAARAGDLWLVNRPGVLYRFDPAKGDGTGEVHLRAGDTAAATDAEPGTTAVVTAAGAVIAVDSTATTVTVARVDPGTAKVARQAPLTVTGGTPPKIRGVAASGATVWVVTDQEAIGLDATTLAVQHRFPVAAGLSPLRGAAVARGGLFSIAADGSALVRIDLGSGGIRTVVQLLPAAPAQFRLPSALAAGDGTVWAMVQRSRDVNDHAVRIAGWNARTGKPTVAVELPSSASIGAITLS